MLSGLIHHFLMILLFGIAVRLSIRMAKRPARRDAFAGSAVLRHGWPIHALGWFSLLLMGVTPIAFLVTDPASFPFPAAVLLCCFSAMFGAMSTYLIAEAIWNRVIINEDGITRHSPWRLPRTIAWADVAAVSYSPAMQWFIVEDQRGEKIRVTYMLIGIGDFASEVRARLAPGVYQPAEAGFSLLGI